MTDRHRAYTSLLMRHRNMLWRLCWNRANGDRDRCQDLMQEVSIALWQHYDKLHPDTPLRQERAWVRWQARSVFYQIERQQNVPTIPITDDLSDSVADEETPHRVELIKELLSTLSPNEQQMMRLYLEGYHGDEIGTKMGVSRDTVYQRIRRIMQKLKYVTLVLLALLFTSAIAVAVVPEWRRQLFGGGEPQETACDTILQQERTPAVKPPADTLPTTNSAPSIPEPEQESWEELTLLESLKPIERYEEMQPLPKDDIADVSIDGTRLVITGAKGELIRIYDYSGKLVDAQRSNGFCFFDLFPYPGLRDHGFILQIGNRPTLSLHL